MVSKVRGFQFLICTAPGNKQVEKHDWGLGERAGQLAGLGVGRAGQLAGLASHFLRLYTFSYVLYVNK